MYGIIWTYQVKPDYLKPFIEAYCADGTWVEFFRRAEGFQRTELIQRHASEECFLTVDRWDSETAFKRFIEQNHHEYEMLDKRFSTFTCNEERIGAFSDEAAVSHCVDEWMNKTAP